MWSYLLFSLFVGIGFVIGGALMLVITYLLFSNPKISRWIMKRTMEIIETEISWQEEKEEM